MALFLFPFQMRSMLFQQIVGLTDILLDGYVNQLETLK